jgi:hypothetical protein
MDRTSLKTVLTLWLIIAFSGCTSTNIIGTYKAPDLDKTYDDIFVVGLVGDQLTDKSVAADLVDMLQKRSVNAQAIKGTFSPDMKLTDAKKKEVASELRSKGFDSILTFALVSIDEKEKYVPGTYSTAAYYPMNYPHYGSYWGYYGYYSPQVYQEGYYTSNTVYTMEAALYDLESEKLIWSARSETMDPSSVNSFSIEYAETVAYQMLKDRVVVKKDK